MPAVLLQDHDIRNPLAIVGPALTRNRERLGDALLRPAFMAAVAAWDLDALPAICILTLASCDLFPAETDGKPSNPRRLLLPAAMACLRYGPCMIRYSVVTSWGCSKPAR
jgi:hypothetical protein